MCPSSLDGFLSRTRTLSGIWTHRFSCRSQKYHSPFLISALVGSQSPVMVAPLLSITRALQQLTGGQVPGTFQC